MFIQNGGLACPLFLIYIFICIRAKSFVCFYSLFFHVRETETNFEIAFSSINPNLKYLSNQLTVFCQTASSKTY